MERNRPNTRTAAQATPIVLERLLRRWNVAVLADLHFSHRSFSVAFFTVDRKRIFEIFFFGYTIHILWTYTYIALENAMYLSPRYFLTPFLPFALNITASVLPVVFLLLYQYCTNHNKNFYLYTILLSAIFAFGLASLEQWLGLLELHGGLRKFHLFLIDLIIVFITYGATRLLVRIQANHHAT
ncbi:hypothetical protein GTNG_1649 [Geobacillus thermodenitrificans NG80-2]|uniref:Uncharacterized protein n=1 Tax=Geobacillus thermodenitrificans (strain NG80-2) TaxID=420246 RepID=A4INV9_GEOTN|nr:hypothetical protein GTNG_1649 [Geobacillus thermodenitrificans NG80-2]